MHSYRHRFFKKFEYENDHILNSEFEVENGGDSPRTGCGRGKETLKLVFQKLSKLHALYYFPLCFSNRKQSLSFKWPLPEKRDRSKVIHFFFSKTFT